MTNGDDPTQAGGQPTPAPEPEETVTIDRKRLILMTLGGLGLAALIGGGLALALGGGDTKDEKQATGTTSTSTSSTSTSTSTTTTTAPSGGGGGGGGGGPTNNAPVVNVSLNKPSTQSCTPSEDPNFPTPPVEVTVSWSTTNATETVLSVDGPGAYGTYGPSASQGFSYGCGDATHTFTVTAKGPGGQTQQSVQFTINNTSQ